MAINLEARLQLVLDNKTLVVSLGLQPPPEPAGL
jgi:hypothetical protein